MGTATHVHTRARRLATAAVGAIALAATVLLAGAVGPDPAAAATVTGMIKGGAGYRVVLVQANGTARKGVVSAGGAFSIRGAKPGNASLHLVNPDGSYYGPVVLRATSTKAFTFVKGTANLAVGPVALKGGYARASRMPTGRIVTLASRTAKATRGKPAGAGKLGRVRTGVPMGLTGAGGDLDLDGIVNAFDIDDNGNLILDNFDRTRRGAGRPRAVASGAAAPFAVPARGSDETLGPPPLTTAGQLFLFSNFWPGTVPGPWASLPAATINANIGTIRDLDALIDLYLPGSLCMGVSVPVDGPATMDGLGNSYLRSHTVPETQYADVSFPRVGDGATTFTADGLVDLRIDGGWSPPIAPGALRADIAPGDCFVVTAANGTQYPATLNYVFNTAPALKSFQFDTDATATDAVYDENGLWVRGDGRPGGSAEITVPAGASRVTLTFWRPQRRGAPGEVASAAGWVDIGGLWYYVDIPGPPAGAGTCDTSDAITNAVSNGVAVPPNQWKGGVLDCAVDMPSDAANTISFTLDMARCFSGWGTFPSGSWFQMGIKATAGYGDNAMTGIWFTME